MEQSSIERFREIPVMIIEDDLILTLSMELMLKKIGFESIKRVDNGEDAVELAKSFKPELILADIYLGRGISGIEAVKKIQALSDTHVIYITGNSDRKNRELANETDHIAYLIKPVTPKDIQQAVEKIWPVNVNN